MGHEEDLKALQEYVAQVKKLSEETEAKLKLAMPRDEYGEIDYHAHRRFHNEYNTNRKEAGALRREILKSILTWFTVGLCTILGSIVVDQYVRPLLAVIGK